MSALGRGRQEGLCYVESSRPVWNTRSCLKQATNRKAYKDRGGIQLALIGLWGSKEITKAVPGTAVKVAIDNSLREKGSPT